MGSQNKGKTGVRMLQKQDPRLPALLSLLATDSHMFCLPLPATAAGRLLELVLLLERHWVEHRLTYPLVLLSAMAYRHACNLISSAALQPAACSVQQAAAADSACAARSGHAPPTQPPACPLPAPPAPHHPLQHPRVCQEPGGVDE